MNAQITLTTDRLLLKGITPAILKELFATMNQAEIIAYFDADEQSFDRMTKMVTHGMETYNISLFYFLICDKNTGTVLGECGFHTWNTTHHRADLFYSMRHDTYKKKGYMKEVVGPILTFGFSELGLHRIQAFIDDANTPSKRILKHYGFTFEGRMRQDYWVNGIPEDSDCYSLLKGEHLR